MFEKENTWIG